MLLHIAIVEDEDEHAKVLTDCLRRFANAHNASFDITPFQNAMDFFDATHNMYDIIFMDIRMPYMNGMTAAHRLREIDKNVALVFTTSLAQYAVASYDVDASAYILKPFSYDDFALKFTRVYNRVSQNKDSSLAVHTENGTIIINAKEIAYCEVFGHSTAFYTTRGKFQKTIALKNVEQLFSSCDFAKCNHCYLVNLAYVQEISGNDVKVHYGGTNDVLQISRNKRKDFIHAWHEFLKNGGRCLC